MNMNIEGNTFDSLRLYADLTADGQADNEKLAALNDQILAAVPGATPEQVSLAIEEAMQQAKNEDPDAPVDMAKIFETAVKQINSQCGDEAIKNIINAWQDFTGVANLSKDDIGQILASPFGFVATDDNTSLSTIHNTMAILMLMMIEIAGEESANQLMEGFAQKDTIMEIAKQKKSELVTKAIVNMVVGLVSAGIQGISSGIALGVSIKGVSESGKALKEFKTGSDIKGTVDPDTMSPDQIKVKNAEAQTHFKQSGLHGAKATSLGGLGQAISGLGGAGAGAVNAFGSLWTGIIDGNIAVLDGESQEAGINKETADKLRAKAEEIIQALFKLLNTMAQARQNLISNIKV